MTPEEILDDFHRETKGLRLSDRAEYMAKRSKAVAQLAKKEVCPECKGEGGLIMERELPPSISDGLILPCAKCGQEKVQFDYTVTDGLWQDVVPVEMRLGVVCLPCLDKLAKEKKADLGANIISLQFTGQDMTIKFIPHSVYYC